MGKRGPNSSKEKPWADALRIAASEKDVEGIRKLRRIAEATVQAAMAGDMAAVKEVGDRLDGKAHQSSDHTERVDVTVTHISEASDEFAHLVTAVADRGTTHRGSDKPQ